MSPDGMSWPGRRAAARSGHRTVNLALQGGGVLGAFTAGVLDRLLEDGRLGFDTVSGASAGSVNAVALAAGLAEGGPERARELLDQLWRDVAIAGRAAASLGGFDAWPFGNGGGAMQNLTVGLVTKVMSPYQFNPLNRNPLREILTRRIDFDRLRAAPVSLMVAATDIATGEARLFRSNEVTVDAVLASCCLPHLFHAVKIGGRHYWDGGYRANPPLLEIVRSAACDDTLIVRTSSADNPRLPTLAPSIAEHLHRLIFNQPLRMEIEAIMHARRLSGGEEGRRAKRHRLHCISAEQLASEIGGAARLTADVPLIRHLRDRGREAAEEWLGRHFADIGRRETLNAEPALS